MAIEIITLSVSVNYIQKNNIPYKIYNCNLSTLQVFKTNIHYPYIQYLLSL